MQTPRSLKVQDAIVETLRLIRTENGYSHTISRILKKFVPHPDREDPVLMVLMGGWVNTWADEAKELTLVERQFFIVTHYRADLDDEDEASLNSEGSKIEDCIKTAIEANQTTLLEAADALSVRVDLGEPLTSVDAVQATSQVMLTVSWEEKVGEQLEG